MMTELKAKLDQEDRESLTPEIERALARLFSISPFYERILVQHPEVIAWLETPLSQERDPEMSLGKSLRREWRRFAGDTDRNNPGYLDTLRRFRRRMALRFAYREIAGDASCRETVEHLSELAELCIRECHDIARARWVDRYGEPIDEDLDQPARFCVLALGKLGGRELNFSSDIDLIYVYEGEGHCRKDGKAGSFANRRFFTKLAETLTGALQEQNEHGFLFRTDLRLRPEGARSPLVRSFSGMENYYAAAGQSWERMALIKARPVAGDTALGGELLESLHAFRYPRHAPPGLLTEISAMKKRTEKEVVGTDNLHENIKSGYGGIREIEFVAQSLQLLHAGRNPFLQTHSTEETLERLVRYGFLGEEDAARLREAYWLLRAVENRLQMRQERQTHSLPSELQERDSLAASFDYGSWQEFETELNRHRKFVRSIYREVIPAPKTDDGFQEWWTFFSSTKTPASVAEKLESWFGESEAAAEQLRGFVCGEAHRRLTQEHVIRFQNLIPTFDTVLPRLASPFAVLRRFAGFAESYGTRNQFLQACAEDSRFFQVLALLFDRSRFIHETLCRHPEIFDEVLRPEILKRRKSRDDTLRELRAGDGDRELRDWLWIYVRAEQIRLAIGELLDYAEPDETAADLTRLADAVLEYTLEQVGCPDGLLPIALGKYGGRELTFGADLDVLFIGDNERVSGQEKAVREAVRLLRSSGLGGPVYEVDLRLRPHGEAGPLVTTLPALRKYHGDRGAGQSWERQLLTRARPLDESSSRSADFATWRDELLYGTTIPPEQLADLWRLRLRVQKERDRVSPPERAYKTAAGGLIDIEFIVQLHQLTHGCRHPSLRRTGTGEVLAELIALEIIPAETGDALLEHFAFLRRIEAHLRRDLNRGVTTLPEDGERRAALARWLGYDRVEAFWEDYIGRLRDNRKHVLALLDTNLGFRPGGTQDGSPATEQIENETGQTGKTG